MKRENIFKASNFFMVRNPILPFDLYRRSYIDDEHVNIDYLANDKVFNEAILIASEDLYNTLIKYKNNEDIDKKEMFIRSINKYFNRITTRPTPFGLFSSVNTGEFKNFSDLKTNSLDNARKYARVDSDWLFEVINILELEEKLYKNVKLYRNNLILVEGTRVKNMYPTKSKKNNNDNSYEDEFYYLNFSKNVEFVLNAADKGCYFTDIASVFYENYPGISQEIIDNFIEELIKKEYIISEFRNPSDNENGLKYILKILDRIDVNNPIINKLIEIDSLINKYNNTFIGDGIDIFNEIKEKMKSIRKIKNLLQVDLVWNNEVSINKNIKLEIEDTINTLINLVPSYLKYGGLNKYKDEFVERYGSNRLIPILDLLDEQNGLGSPYTKEFNSENSEIYERDNRIQFYLKQKIIEAISEKDDEIVLFDDEIENFKLKDLVPDDFSRSMEINFFIKSDSMLDIDKNNYKIFIGPNRGANGAGKTFGRFLYILDDEINNNIKNINKLEQDIVKDDIEIVELNTIFQSDRIGNVTNNRNFRNYEINLVRNVEDNRNIDIRDIFIGIENNEFYIKSKKLNKRIDISTNHMLNNLLGNDIYRFLREISELNKINGLSPLINFKFDDLNYIPRIRYKNVILSPKTYKINSNLIDRKIDKERFKEYLVRLKQKFNIPDIVYITESDNRILINLNNDYHIEELYLTFKKSGEHGVVLQEFESDITKSWSQYNYEFVMPLIRNNKYFDNKKAKVSLNNLISTKSEITNYSKDSLSDNKVRCVFPGGDWIYIKLYNNIRRSDEFIGNEISSFMDLLKKESLIGEYFFIRYKDEKEHIRLRLKINNYENMGEIFKRLNVWFNYLSEIKLISNVNIDTYDKEIERYGGEETIDSAEKFFAMDSEVIANYLKLLENKQINFSKENFAICNMINIMESINLDYDTQLKLFDSIISKDEYRNEFSKNRKELLKIGNSDENWAGLNSVEDGQVILELMDNLGSASKEYFDIIEEVDIKGGLQNTKVDILLSIFHMHCNRLFGIDREKEREVHALVRHTLYALKYFKKNRVLING